MGLLNVLLSAPVWAGLGVLVAVLLAFIGFYYAQRQKVWLYLTGATIVLIVGFGLGAELQRARLKQLPEPSSESRTVTVDASKGWQSTGLFVRTGMRVSFSGFSGEWVSDEDGISYSGAGRSYNCRKSDLTSSEYPSVTTTFRRACAEPLPMACLGALIARVGERDFSVFEQSSIIAQEDGEVQLRINDNDKFLNDNSGGLRIVVTAEPVRTDMRQELRMVSANLAWQPTGIEIAQNSDVIIEVVRGEWIDGLYQNTGYNTGEGNCNICSVEDSACLVPLPGFYYASLIAKIEPATMSLPSQVFGVGRQTRVVAEQGGKLFLQMNDQHLNDNDGSLLVKITVAQ